MPRFKLIGVMNGNLFGILDETDGTTEVCVESEIMKFLGVGIEIGGITPAPEQNTFRYNDEYFVGLDTSAIEAGVSEEDYFSEEDDDDYNFGFDDEFEEDDEEAEGETVEEDDLDDYADEDEEGFDISSDDLEDEYDDGFDDGFDDEDDDDWDVNGEDTITQFYNLIGDEASDLYKRFYLWSSQILFDGTPSKGQLNITKRQQSKLDKLAELRLQADGWIYAGRVDLGAEGGHCTLGHALRYQHFAWDKDLDLDGNFWIKEKDHWRVNWDNINQLEREGRVIKFGIDCIGDFFSVATDVLAEIKNAQLDSAREMHRLYHVYSDPTTLANAKASFKTFELLADGLVIETVMQQLTDKSSIDNDLLLFYKEFKRKGVVYPRSLVKRVQNILLKRNTHRYKPAKTVRQSAVSKCLKYFKGVSNLRDFTSRETNYSYSYGGAGRYFTRSYLEAFLAIQSGGIYAYNPYSDVLYNKSKLDIEEGKRSKESKSYYQCVTGVSEDDKKAMDSVLVNYNCYPMLLNQIQASDFKYKGKFDDIRFDLDYLHLVDRYEGLRTKLFEVSKMEFNIFDSELKDGRYVVSDSTYMRSYDIIRAWYEKYPDLGEERHYSSKIFVGSDVGLNTMEDVCKYLEDRVAKYEQAKNDFEAYLIQKRDADIAKRNKELDEEETRKQEEAVRKAEAEKQRAEEEKKKAEEAEKAKAALQSVRYETLKRVVDNSNGEDLKTYVVSFEDMKDILNYCEDIPEFRSVVDKASKVAYGIMSTLNANGKQPTVKQEYFLKLSVRRLLEKHRDGEIDLLANAPANTNQGVSNEETPISEPVEAVKAEEVVTEEAVKEEVKEEVKEAEPVTTTPEPAVDASGFGLQSGTGGFGLQMGTSGFGLQSGTGGFGGVRKHGISDGTAPLKIQPKGKSADEVYANLKITKAENTDSGVISRDKVMLAENPDLDNIILQLSYKLPAIQTAFGNDKATAFRVISLIKGISDKGFVTVSQVEYIKKATDALKTIDIEIKPVDR